MSPALVLSVIGLLAGGFVLSTSIPRIVCLVRESVVARLPATPHQTVEVAEPGEYVLHIEGPRLALLAPVLRPGGPRFTLHDPALGREVPVRGVVVPTRTAGLSRVRLSVARFAAEHRGAFELHAEGLPADPRVELVLAHPTTGRLVALILATVLGGLLLTGGLVGAILALALG